MANAKARTVTKTKTVVQEYVEEDGFVLELDKDEAFALYLLLYRVGGSRSGPRRHFDNIRRSLCAAGLKWDCEMSNADAKVKGYPIFPDSF